MFKISLKLFVIGLKQKNIQRRPIFLTDADYDYILDENERQDKNYFESNVSGNSYE